MAANTNPLTYNGYVSQIATMAVVNTITVSGVVVASNDPAFDEIIPQMLNYAELRIQRDLDLLPLQTTKSYFLTAGANILPIPTDDFVTIQTINLVSGIDSTPILPASKEFIQNVCGSSYPTLAPQYFAMLGGDSANGGQTSNNVLLGPYPDSAYTVSVVGTTRAPSLYKSANATDANVKTTFISTYLPDMLIMASMIYISAYQRNFGRMSDDPAMAQSYEGQYQVLLRGAMGEEYRKKFEASAWSSMSASPPATPVR